MKRKNKIFIALVVLFSVVSYFAFGICSLFVVKHKGKQVEYVWSASDEFDIQSIATVSKKKDKDFVILNLADIQMCDMEDIFNFPIIHREISYLIEKTKPDLITLSGDQTWSNENLISTLALICWLDEYKIPYAPVFGNHDYGNIKNSATADQNFCCDLYENAKYSLFKRGPSNLGALGNYVINIMEEDKIYKTLYMLDAGYENKITTEQIEWVQWNADGIKEANGGEYCQAMCFFHKPIPEFLTAYNNYVWNTGEVEAIGDVYVHYSLSGTQQNGFFDLAKSINVKDIVCGHQHGNNFSLKYEGINLTFALKTGELGGYYADDTVYLNGATYFVIGEQTEIKNIFVDKNQFHIKNSINAYYE